MEHWHNFDLELFDHDSVGDIESVRVRVARSPAGEQRDAQTVRIPGTLRAAADALSKDTLTFDQTIELGRALAAVLLPDAAARLFDDSRARLGDGEGLRLRIELRALPLADLPWEFVHRAGAHDDAPENGFLALDRALSVVRYEPVPRPATGCAPLNGAAVEIAMLLANPTIPGWATLDVAREADTVTSALADEPDVELTVHRNATDRSLNDALDSRPHVFHFAGHGRFRLRPAKQFGLYEGDGELLFENEDGGADAVSARKLAVRMHGSGVRLAVLNNCESARRDELNAFTGVAPALVRDGVAAVVAMQYSIRDAHALRFARRFYHNLAAHESVDAALTSARVAMFDTGNAYTRDWGIPVLYLRSDQAVLFPDKASASVLRMRRLGVHGWANLALSTALVFALVFLYLRQVEPRLPFGAIVGGVLAAALVAAIAWLKTIAGDAWRELVFGLLRRRAATGVLVALLGASVSAIALVPAPVVVRVLGGVSLLAGIGAQGLDSPIRTYTLRVTSGDESTAVVNDFRKSGAALAGSHSLAARLSARQAGAASDRMKRYLGQTGLPAAQSEQFLGLYSAPPALLGLASFANAERLEVLLMRDGERMACRTLSKAAIKAELTGQVAVIFLEKDDECQ